MSSNEFLIRVFAILKLSVRSLTPDFLPVLRILRLLVVSYKNYQNFSNFDPKIKLTRPPQFCAYLSLAISFIISRFLFSNWNMSSL